MIRLWPRNLVGQLTVALALTLLAGQAASLALVSRGQQQQAVAQTAGVIAARIARNSERMARLGTTGQFPPPRRGVVIAATPLPLPPGAVPAPRLAAQVTVLLADAGYDYAQIRAWDLPAPRGSDRGDRHARAAARVDAFDGRVWISITGRRAQPGRWLVLVTVGQTLLLYAILLVPILLIARRVARPLGELTAAVRQASAGGVIPALTPRGPADVSDLMAAFGQYQAAMTAMLADKDQMLGAVGHDLRTPLASLRVRAEQVADPVLRAKMADTIADMAAMLNDILAVAQGSDGDDSEAAELVDISALVQIIAGEYRERGLPAAWVGGNGGALARVRPLRLSRAIRNLIDNGIAYGHAARIRVEQGGAGVTIIISDDGPGLSAAQSAAMTAPFVRGEASRSRATGGAGLGLALAKAIAEGEGGALTLANRADGSGLDAAITLPAAPDQQ